MGRLSVWVLLGLTLFAVTCNDVLGSSSADIGPTETECRPHIEKAINQLKTGEPLETEANAANDPDSEDEEQMQQDQPPDDSNDDDDDDDDDDGDGGGVGGGGDTLKLKEQILPGSTDIDGDGIPNEEDSDIDGDVIPNEQDDDMDGDGILNVHDSDMDGDIIPNEKDIDMDGDGVLNVHDKDIDGDGVPNVDDSDLDGDGVPNSQDVDMDGDGIPNEADDDKDGDGIFNKLDSDVDGDGIPNHEDDDVDGDGVPNAEDVDMDGDGVPNAEDNDLDGDGVLNDQDNDLDGDGIPNDQDDDIDGDGVGNDDDEDIDGDGVPNDDDDDIDGDGVPNHQDDDIDGDGVPNDEDADMDGDGVPNDEDNDIDGDGVLNEDDDDIDGDGIPNDRDNDIDGDGIPNENDSDIDGDGIPNDVDDDIDGDGVNNDEDNDIDGDGVPNDEDNDIDGDGVLNEDDGDIDGDGIANDDDNDLDGDGIPNDVDNDIDGDGIPNNQDDDIDGDGIHNEHDNDIDGDGVGNDDDEDIDGDGIHNVEDDDVDGDGVSNARDDDIDGDGILNIHEGERAAVVVTEHEEAKIVVRKVRDVDASTDDGAEKANGSKANDMDGDGILDHEDDDKDGDGVPDHQDDDIDGDGILNEHDDDKDGDGIPNELDKSSASEEKEPDDDKNDVKDDKDDKDDDNDDDDTMPEDELLWEGEIPETLRSHEHITELLQLDEESSAKEKALERIADIILRDIKRIYENAIKPLEMMYKYRDLSNRHFSDPEIFSKPLLLFMGPWSGGKSTIINYLTNNDYTQHSLRTGAEPSPAYFNILMWGNETQILDGTQLAADYTFSGLQKFGEGLENRLRGLKMSNKLLEKVNIVEIPGILEVRKQVARLFPFNDACQWFIDRADIILLVYDPAKLDVGPETEAILDQLKGREYQTRILLNKADTVKPEELLRVQSALIWNISPMMSSAQPPLMYTTSLWSHPYQDGAPTRLLMAQERALLRDLRTAIDKRIEHKIASARRFAVRVRNHAKMVDCYLNTYYNHKTLFGNKKRIADNIIENPQDFHIYEGLSTLTNISRYDLPDPEVYRDFFRLHPLFEFKKLSETCTYFRGCPISKLDVAIAYDLPELAGKYKKMAENALAAGNDAKQENMMEDGHRPAEKIAALHGQREKNKS